MKHSVKSICETLWGLEKDLSLFEKREKDVCFWALVRFNIYYKVVQKTGLFGHPHPAESLDLLKKPRVLLQKTASILKALTLKNAFVPALLTALRGGRKKTVIMPHIRHVRGEDIYSKDVIKQHPDAMLLYKDWRGVHYKGSSSMAMAAAFSWLGWQCVKLWHAIPFVFTHQTQQDKICADIQKNLEDEFGFDENLVSYTRQKVLFFTIHRFFYRLLFKLIRAKKLYIVVGYGSEYVIAAAHDCGMDVTEIQHGIFTRYHLGYSYPVDADKIPYKADTLMCFGRFWPENTPLPATMKVTYMPCHFIKDLAGNFDDIAKNKRLIVFTSQGAIGHHLFDFFKDAASLMPEYSFIYRLHPHESLDVYHDKIANDPLPHNATLSHKAPNIFELLAQAEYQVGVFSTTLFEGMVLGSKAISITLPGHEYMQSAVTRGDVISISNVDEFSAAIQSAQLPQDTNYYYQQNESANG